MPDQPFVIGVDIGGTKIKAGAVAVGHDHDEVAVRIIASRHVATPRAEPAAFYDAVAALVGEVRRGVSEAHQRFLPLVAVAHPGRFLSDGRLARGTTPNLGTSPGQFDGLCPARELERRLQCPVIAENDAVAQMRFGVDALLREPAVRPHLLGETVVYLGPGTGMGGGVAHVGTDGAVTTLTDGHLFDMQVPGVGDGTLTAEEIFTGPAIARRVAEANAGLAHPIDPPRGGRLDEILAEPDAPAEHRATAESIADEYGGILACLIRAIYHGTIVKVRLDAAPGGRLIRHVDEPDRAWSAADREAVRGVRRFLFGGFIGCSSRLGARIRRRALELLRHQGLADLAIFQIPVDSAEAGLLGIVYAVPANRIRELLQTRSLGSERFS